MATVPQTEKTTAEALSFAVFVTSQDDGLHDANGLIQVSGLCLEDRPEIGFEKHTLISFAVTAEHHDRFRDGLAYRVPVRQRQIELDLDPDEAHVLPLGGKPRLLRTLKIDEGVDLSHIEEQLLNMRVVGYLLNSAANVLALPPLEVLTTEILKEAGFPEPLPLRSQIARYKERLAIEDKRKPSRPLRKIGAPRAGRGRNQINGR